VLVWLLIFSCNL